MDKVVVIGGGISGLATAYRLVQEANRRNRPVEVVVLEQLSRPGGTMRTHKVDGFTIEAGPNGFLDSRVSIMALARDLGIADRLQRADDGAKKRYICRGGKLVRLPESPAAFLKSPLLSVGGKARLMMEMWAPPKSQWDETVGEFAARRLGSEARDYLIAPMVSGIFAGDADRLSLECAFPRIAELEAVYGGLFKGMFGVMAERRRAGVKSSAGPAGPAGPSGLLTSLPEGIEGLVLALTDALGDRVLSGVEVETVERGGACWLVRATQDGRERTFVADAVVLASPSFISADLIRGLGGPLPGLLASIPYSPISVVATAFDADAFDGPLDGFGFLAPKVENRKILGALWDSSVYPGRAPQGKVLVRSMLGGAWSPDRAFWGDDEILDVVMGELRALMNVQKDPIFSRIYRWEKGIPHYERGHKAKLTLIEKARVKFAGLHLCSNAYRGISVDDCARSAAEEAVAVADYLWSNGEGRGA